MAPDTFSLHDSFLFPWSSICVNLLSRTRSRVPVMDGVTFARALHERPAVRDVPILVISADGNPARAASVGARGYLAKPFDIDTLLGHVCALSADGAASAPQAGA